MIDTPGSSDDLLEAYARLVREWAPKLDLVAPGDLDRFEERHIADSLRLLPLVTSLPEGPAVDVGSGAGLPGIPLAIAQPGRPWRLLEPRARRAGFLEEVVRALGLSCRVVRSSARAATALPDLAGEHVFAVARALAPPETALSLLAPLVRADGVAAVFLGGNAQPPPEATLWAEGIAIVDRRKDPNRE